MTRLHAVLYKTEIVLDLSYFACIIIAANPEENEMVNLLLALIYISFISLGLPDSVLGAAWPTIYPEFGVPFSYAGLISAIISVGTITSSLFSDKLTRRLGTGKLTAFSVASTALALFGFSLSHSFIALCILAIPYGLGAGSVDAALNNYVAVHYKSRHMSWLHCFWGVGASLGPYIMGYTLSGGQTWNIGYRYIAIIQIVLSFVLLISIPLWKHRIVVPAVDGSLDDRELSLREILSIKGAKEVMLFFFSYCAVEQVMIVWSGTYLNLHKGYSAEAVASLAGMYCLGLTIGRGISGFVTMKLDDTSMIRLGIGIITVGVFILMLPGSPEMALAGLALVGLGSAPVYPCVIHSTPGHFGADKSQAIVGVQMASAYTGTCIMPPVFGVVADNLGVHLLPYFSLGIIAVMVFMHERLVKKTVSV